MVHARESQQHPKDKSRELQRKLYIAAKRNRNRRFHALYDRISRPDILWRAWKEVKAKGGSAGVDQETIRDIEDAGEEQFVLKLKEELDTEGYKPLAVRRVYIPKPDGRKRGLGIPAVKDRVVQQACRIVIEPIFEANFQDCSYGFRPRRSAQQAVVRTDQRLLYNWYIVEVDVQKYFDSIDQKLLMKLVQRRVSDRQVLKLIKLWLRAGVLEAGEIRRSETGTPQGGVISPLLANIYLHVLDMYWQKRYSKLGELIRYADDFIILCKWKKEANEALQAVEKIFEILKLKMHPDKTRVVKIQRTGFDFLGFHFRKLMSRINRKHVPYIWPSVKSMKRIREKVKAWTIPRWRKIPLAVVVRKLNSIITGWRNYFRVGNSSRKFQQLDHYVLIRIWIFLRRKHRGRKLYLKDFARDIYPKLGLTTFYKSENCCKVSP